MKSGNSAMVRQINREIIRDALKNQGDANIAELSRRTGLSPATCSNIIPELLTSGEVRELEERKSQGGRPARIYAYNPNHTLVAAILLRYADGLTIIRHSVRNSAGIVVDEGRDAPSPFTRERLDAVLDALTLRHPPIKAVAVSIPGVVHNGEVEICDIPELAGAQLEAHIHARHNLATVTENDMNFAAVGYLNRNPDIVGPGLAFMVLPADKCPGCGIVVGGKLVKGMSSFAGELSFIPFGDNPVPCRRGDRPHLVDMAAKLTCAVVAVVNPGAVVISGDAMHGDMAEEIRTQCLKHIPDRHLPVLLVKPDYEDDCFDGMVAMALESLSCEVRLVSRKRSWTEE